VCRLSEYCETSGKLKESVSFLIPTPGAGGHSLRADKSSQQLTHGTRTSPMKRQHRIRLIGSSSPSLPAGW